MRLYIVSFLSKTEIRWIPFSTVLELCIHVHVWSPYQVLFTELNGSGTHMRTSWDGLDTNYIPAYWHQFSQENKFLKSTLHYNKPSDFSYPCKNSECPYLINYTYSHLNSENSSHRCNGTFNLVNGLRQGFQTILLLRCRGSHDWKIVYQDDFYMLWLFPITSKILN